MNKTAQDWIKKLCLQGHPEGGYYKEVYRSKELINRYGLPERFMGNRCFSTSIYYLLEGKDFSSFHKIKSDEIWHYYTGNSAICIYILNHNGELEKKYLGIDVSNDETPQIAIPYDNYFAAELIKKDSFALIGCTVSPGFDFGDFDIGHRQDLMKNYPLHAELINRLAL